MPIAAARFGDATRSVDHAIRDRLALPRGKRLASARSGAAPLDIQPWTNAHACAIRSVHGHRLEGDDPVPHARQERQASSVSQPLEADRDEKARSVVALSRVPRLAGFAGSPPAAGLYSAVNRPLVRIPANRHTTTGTCEIGQHIDTRFWRLDKYFLRGGTKFLHPRVRRGMPPW